jgi:hypothetical protein
MVARHQKLPEQFAIPEIMNEQKKGKITLPNLG